VLRISDINDMPSPEETDLPASIEIALDKLSVRLRPRSDRPARTLDGPAIITQLTSLGVKIDARCEAQVREFCRPRKSGQPAVPVVVATGTPPVDDVPPYLELVDTMARATGESRHVKTKDPVATLVPRNPGRDGIDVMGNPVPRRQAETLPAIDASLTPAPRGCIYLAAIDGVIRVRGTGPTQSVVVLPCLRHAGDVSGKVIHSTGEVVIDGAVRGGSLRAGGDIRVGSDMENSMAMCDGEFSAAELRSSKIEVAGNCTAKSVNQSRISCGQELKVENGNIVGGHVIAAGGLRCKSLGAPDFTKTLIEIGINHHLGERLSMLVPEIEARLAKASRIRLAVDPLLQSKQTLTPQQQLKIGALLTEADVLETVAQNQRRELREEYEVALKRCRNEVHVSEIVHPGVTIRFPGAQTTARIALRGPCRICLETRDGQPSVVLYRDGAPGVPLELCKLNEDWRSAAKRIAA
jgi:hypothetical protein